MRISDWSSDVCSSDLLLMTGFDDDELAQMLADIGETEGSDTDEEPASDEDDDVPEPTKQPISRPGDVWQLGPPCLICGDASDPSVIPPLLPGDQASLCFPISDERRVRHECGRKCCSRWGPNNK